MRWSLKGMCAGGSNVSSYTPLMCLNICLSQYDSFMPSHTEPSPLLYSSTIDLYFIIFLANLIFIHYFIFQLAQLTYQMMLLLIESNAILEHFLEKHKTFLICSQTSRFLLILGHCEMRTYPQYLFFLVEIKIAE